ncbi:urotensin-2 receptor-like [Pituophis catenifer annectens]|uniref:urotensin-2 receptor-like n=1 Tax=Pituophis catenifer annectens TaxID=94852 RepID=UPI0039938EAE
METAEEFENPMTDEEGEIDEQSDQEMDAQRDNSLRLDILKLIRMQGDDESLVANLQNLIQDREAARKGHDPTLEATDHESSKKRNGKDQKKNGVPKTSEGDESAAVLGAVLSLKCVIGVAGNLYALVVVWASALASSLHVHLINLALADLLYLLTAPFIVHNGLVKDWPFGEAGCRILFSLDLLTKNASIFLLTLMSCECYTAVVHPFQAASRVWQCSQPLAIAVWFLSFALALLMMVMIHQEECTMGNGAGVHCLGSPTWSEEQYKVYLSILFGTSIVAPGIVIGPLYWHLARSYWLSQTRGGLGHSPKNQVFLLILVIVLAFWACYMPFWIWQLLPLYCPLAAHLPIHTEFSVNHLVTCLTYGNSCINPFLYTLLTRNYREYLHSHQRGASWNFLPCLKSRNGSQREGATGT